MRKLILIFLLFCLSIPVMAIEESVSHALLHEAKAYGAARLDENWEVFVFYEIPPVQADVYWLNEELNAVIAVNQSIFYNSAQQSEFFEDMEAYFDVIFMNYSPYEVETICSSNWIIQREFTAVNQGNDFLIRHYFEQIGSYEVRLIGLYFPAEYEDELNETSALFYPDFAQCPED